MSVFDLRSAPLAEGLSPKNAPGRTPHQSLFQAAQRWTFISVLRRVQLLNVTTALLHVVGRAWPLVDSSTKVLRMLHDVRASTRRWSKRGSALTFQRSMAIWHRVPLRC